MLPDAGMPHLWPRMVSSAAAGGNLAANATRTRATATSMEWAKESDMSSSVA